MCVCALVCVRVVVGNYDIVWQENFQSHMEPFPDFSCFLLGSCLLSISFCNTDKAVITQDYLAGLIGTCSVESGTGTLRSQWLGFCTPSLPVSLRPISFTLGPKTEMLRIVS